MLDGRAHIFSHAAYIYSVKDISSYMGMDNTKKRDSEKNP